MDALPLLRRAFMASTMFSTIAMTFLLFSQSFAEGTLLARNPLNYQHLERRNLSTFFNSIPNSCQADCDVVVGAAHNCQHLSCVCTNDNAYGLLRCVNCMVALTPYANGIVEQYQLLIDEWTNDYCRPFATPSLQITRPGSSPSPTPSSAPVVTSSAAVVRMRVASQGPVLYLVLALSAATIALIS